MMAELGALNLTAETRRSAVREGLRPGVADLTGAPPGSSLSCVSSRGGLHADLGLWEGCCCPRPASRAPPAVLAGGWRLGRCALFP